MTTEKSVALAHVKLAEASYKNGYLSALAEVMALPEVPVGAMGAIFKLGSAVPPSPAIEQMLRDVEAMP